MLASWHLIRAGLCCLLLGLVHRAEQSQVGEEQHLSALYNRNLRRLVSLVDEDVDPCDDFFRHACGFYEHEFASDRSGDTESAEQNEFEDGPRVPPLLYNVEDRMHFFEENYQGFGSVAGRLLGRLYAECRALKSVSEPTRSSQAPSAGRSLEQQWLRMLRQIPFVARDVELFREWPYLRFQWRELNERWDLNWATMAAAFAAHGIDTFLRVFFAEATIYIAPVDDLRCGELEEVRDTLRRLLRDGRNAQIADIVAGELWTFCHALGAATANVDSGHDETAVLRDERLSEYLGMLHAHLNLTEVAVGTARTVVVDARRVAATLDAFERTEPRVVYNYVLWRVHAALRRASDCYLLTEEFEDLLLAEYWQWHVFAEHFGRDVALATFLYHTTRFQQRRRAVLMGDQWDAFLARPPRRRDFNVPRLLRTYANAALQPDRLVATAYSPLRWRRGAFYANLLAMRRLRLRAAFTEHVDVDVGVGVDDEDPNHPLQFLRQFVHFTIGVLRQPLFHYFATQGLEMWRASGLLHSSDGFYTALDCLEHQSALHGGEAPIFRPLAAEEVEELFRFHRAFAAAQRDYRFWLDGEFFAFAEDLVLGQFGLDSRRVLFYAVAQQHCGRSDALLGARVNRGFMNTAAFQEAFTCGPEAPMNPADKCMGERGDL